VIKPLQCEWEARAEHRVVLDDHGEPVLMADDFEATYSAGDMNWSFQIDSDESIEDAQWIAEKAYPVLDALYQRIGAERARRIRERT
jgi:hypothetical protein